MHNHVNNVLRDAERGLRNWIAQNPRLCELKVNFQNFPYHLNSAQLLYILRYYAAYFAENNHMYSTLSTYGLAHPVVSSIGCGSMVDAWALSFVYQNFIYRGYDLNNWCGGDFAHPRAVFCLGDIRNVAQFSHDTNCIVFPRSINDIGRYLPEVRAVEATNFQSDILYLAASCVASDGGIDFGRQSLDNFSQRFLGYHIVDNVVFDGRQSPGNIDNHFTGAIAWPDAFLQSLHGLCNGGAGEDCLDEACERLICQRAMQNFSYLYYYILVLRRG